MTATFFDPTSRTRIERKSLSSAEVAVIAADRAPVLLVDCDLEDADLSRIDMTDWRFEHCVLKRANLTGVALERAEFAGCRGAFANFNAAELGEAKFQSSDFNNARFTGASLSQASFNGCKLTGADFSRAKNVAITFYETTLSAAILAGFSFRKHRLIRVDFSMADLANCDFRDTVFEESSLREANLVDARFESADLRGADLGGLRLNDARKFKGATISRGQAGELLAELGLKVR